MVGPSGDGLVTRFAVLAPSAADNSLGRALCVAATCEVLGPVELIAPSDGPMWVGASGWPIEVRRVPRPLLQSSVEQRDLHAFPPRAATDLPA